MRVVIENFDMTTSEVERLWAEQDKYIDLLESQLRQSEEKVRKESQRVQRFQTKVIRRNQKIAKLKASLARSPDVRQTLTTVRRDHNYARPVAVEDAGQEKSEREEETESQAVLRNKNSKSTQTVPNSKSTQSTQTEDSVKSTRIYSEDEIKKGSLLMFSSLKTYKLLRKFEPRRYPGPSTIRKHIQGFRCYYGLNDEMFFVLRQKLVC